MLEMMYAVSEQTGTEADSVADFIRRFIKDSDTEDEFYAVIRDTRMTGFKEGIKAVLTLITEVQ